MELHHFIHGQEEGEQLFTVIGPFAEYPFTLHLACFNGSHFDFLRQTLTKAYAPPLEERRRWIYSLAGFEPSAQCLQSICYLLGMPITWVRESIEQGKKIALTIASYPSKDSHKKVAISISPNDPREIFYFVAHTLLAGTPTVIKLSSREPMLGAELIRYLHQQKLPPGLLNLIYADSSSPEESMYVQSLMEWVDLPIVMGSAVLSSKQISFCAEHSRGLVLNAEQALPHLKASITSPLSCLAERNYLVVGEQNYYQLLDALVELYSNLKPGHLLDPETTMGIIQQEALEEATTILKLGQMVDTIKVIYPYSITLDASTVAKGLVVEHYSEDHATGSNPLLVSSLPLYITGIRLVGTIQEALRDLEVARHHIEQTYNIPKSMALSIYGSEPSLYKVEEYLRLQNIAFDIHHNKSPVQVDGFIHQGIKLNEVLTT